MKTKFIVVSHDTRCDGVGNYNGMIFTSKEAARKYLEGEGFDSLEGPGRNDFGWNKDGDVYGDEEDQIELIEREVNE